MPVIQPPDVANRATRRLDVQDVAARRIRPHGLTGERGVEITKPQAAIAIVLVGRAEEQRAEERSFEGRLDDRDSGDVEMRIENLDRGDRIPDGPRLKGIGI